MIPGVVYVLCTLTSVASMTLLLRAYYVRRVRLLLWSGLCFAGLAVNNILLVMDLIVVPGYDLSTVRQSPAVVGVSLLIFGLVYDLRD